MNKRLTADNAGFAEQIDKMRMKKGQAEDEAKRLGTVNEVSRAEKYA